MYLFHFSLCMCIIDDMRRALLANWKDTVYGKLFYEDYGLRQAGLRCISLRIELRLIYLSAWVRVCLPLVTFLVIYFEDSGFYV
jgi:hypothetical protein